MKPHWYKITLITCPICGRWKKMKERQYTLKPTWLFRHPEIETYDGCQGY
jgi:hypothetical protein